MTGRQWCRGSRRHSCLPCSNPYRRTRDRRIQRSGRRLSGTLVQSVTAALVHLWLEKHTARPLADASDVDRPWIRPSRSARVRRRSPDSVQRRRRVGGRRRRGNFHADVHGGRAQARHSDAIIAASVEQSSWRQSAWPRCYLWSICKEIRQDCRVTLQRIEWRYLAWTNGTWYSRTLTSYNVNIDRLSRAMAAMTTSWARLKRFRQYTPENRK